MVAVHHKGISYIVDEMILLTAAVQHRAIVFNRTPRLLQNVLLGVLDI